MAIEVLRENLKKGLQIVERITGKNLVLPILNNVYLKTEKNSLRLATTDLETAIYHWILAKTDKEQEITVPVKLFSNLLSFLSDQKINLEIKDKILILSGENYKTEIKGLDPKDFPIIPKIEKNEWIEIDPLSFTTSISQVIDFCSTTQVRPELTGVYFFFSEKNVKIVATDSFRLAEKTLNYQTSQGNLKEEKAFILPRSAAREITGIFNESEQKIKIFFTSNQVLVENYFFESETPQTQLISRLIEGEFPNYQDIIPKESKTEILADKSQFLNYLKAASIFAGRGNEVNLKVDAKDKRIEILTENTDVGSIQFTLPAKINGEKTKICFNYKFLLEGISKIKGDEIYVGLNGEDGPGLIKSQEDSSFLYILMPIKPT